MRHVSMVGTALASSRRNIRPNLDTKIKVQIGGTEVHKTSARRVVQRPESEAEARGLKTKDKMKCHRQAMVSRCFQIGFCILTLVWLVPLRTYRLKRLSRVIM
jgi:hypothetical protein